MHKYKFLLLCIVNFLLVINCKRLKFVKKTNNVLIAIGDGECDEASPIEKKTWSDLSDDLEDSIWDWSDVDYDMPAIDDIYAIWNNKYTDTYFESQFKCGWPQPKQMELWTKSHLVACRYMDPLNDDGITAKLNAFTLENLKDSPNKRENLRELIRSVRVINKIIEDNTYNIVRGENPKVHDNWGAIPKLVETKQTLWQKSCEASIVGGALSGWGKDVLDVYTSRKNDEEIEMDEIERLKKEAKEIVDEIFDSKLVIVRSVLEVPKKNRMVSCTGWDACHLKKLLDEDQKNWKAIADVIAGNAKDFQFIQNQVKCIKDIPAVANLWKPYYDGSLYTEVEQKLTSNRAMKKAITAKQRTVAVFELVELQKEANAKFEFNVLPKLLADNVAVQKIALKVIVKIMRILSVLKPGLTLEELFWKADVPEGIGFLKPSLKGNADEMKRAINSAIGDKNLRSLVTMTYAAIKELNVDALFRTNGTDKEVAGVDYDYIQEWRDKFEEDDYCSSRDFKYTEPRKGAVWSKYVAWKAGFEKYDMMYGRDGNDAWTTCTVPKASIRSPPLKDYENQAPYTGKLLGINNWNLRPSMGMSKEGEKNVGFMHASKRLGMPYAAGPSSTTVWQHNIARIIGLNEHELMLWNLALSSWMIEPRDHTFIEIKMAAQDEKTNGATCCDFDTLKEGKLWQNVYKDSLIPAQYVELRARQESAIKFMGVDWPAVQSFTLKRADLYNGVKWPEVLTTEVITAQGKFLADKKVSGTVPNPRTELAKTLPYINDELDCPLPDFIFSDNKAIRGSAETSVDAFIMLIQPDSFLWWNYQTRRQQKMSHALYVSVKKQELKSRFKKLAGAGKKGSRSTMTMIKNLGDWLKTDDAQHAQRRLALIKTVRKENLLVDLWNIIGGALSALYTTDSFIMISGVRTPQDMFGNAKQFVEKYKPKDVDSKKFPWIWPRKPNGDAYDAYSEDMNYERYEEFLKFFQNSMRFFLGDASLPSTYQLAWGDTRPVSYRGQGAYVKNNKGMMVFGKYDLISTSFELPVAYEFGYGNTLIAVVDYYQARNIAPLSRYEYEAELLFPAFSRFKVHHECKFNEGNREWEAGTHRDCKETFAMLKTTDVKIIEKLKKNSKKTFGDGKQRRDLLNCVIVTQA